MLAKGKENLEGVVEEGSDKLSVIDLGLIAILNSVVCPANHIFVSPFLLEIGTRHHVEESVTDGVNLGIWRRSGYEWCKGWNRAEVITALFIST